MLMIVAVILIILALTALGIFANTIGADSREGIEDTHTGGGVHASI
jgi:hypothetical protein